MSIENIKKHIENNWLLYAFIFSIVIVGISMFNKELAFSLVAGPFTFYWLKASFFSEKAEKY